MKCIRDSKLTKSLVKEHAPLISCAVSGIISGAVSHLACYEMGTGSQPVAAPVHRCS